MPHLEALDHGFAKQRNRAEDIMLRLIQELLREHDKFIFATELQYGSEHRRVDLCAIDSSHSYAYEIKSASDNLDRLSGQLACSCLVFDYVYAVVDNRFLAKVETTLPREIGILTYNCSHASALKKERKALLQKKHSKAEILYSIPFTWLRASALSQGLINASCHLGPDALRTKLSHRSLEILHSLWLKYLKNKLSLKYTIFKESLEGRLPHTTDDLIFNDYLIYAPPKRPIL